MKNSVSVVIPVYNRYAMLTQALRSVLDQTIPPQEIVVVDDGSTDITAERAAALTALDPRVIYHRIVHLGRPGAVRNAGVDRCRGGWIAFLDSDDLWHPEKLALQLACAERHPEAPLIHTRERWLRGDREVSQTGQRHQRSGWVFADALVKCIIGPSTAMIHRDIYLALDGFRADMEVAEDYEFWLRLTAFHPVAYVDRPLIDKRAGHGDQLSEKYGHIERFRIEGLRRLVDEDYFRRPTRMPRWRRLHRMACVELGRKCSIYARGASRRGRDDEAARFEALAARYAE